MLGWLCLLGWLLFATMIIFFAMIQRSYKGKEPHMPAWIIGTTSFWVIAIILKIAIFGWW